MPIVSYKIEPGAVQWDGLLSIVERYIRDDGREVMFCSTVGSKVDLDKFAIDRVAVLDAQESAPKPIVDLFDAKIDAARDAYKNKDAVLAKALLAEATLAVDAVAAEALVVDG